jgi:4-phytase / acid phosphatase
MFFHLLLSCGLVVAQKAARRLDELQFVFVLSRHGVRSPIWSVEQLNQYSAQAWPTWNVPPGNLTSHGERLMALFGTYYRAYFVEARLLTPKGCADAGRVYVWADTEERTLDTGRALLAGMLPRCDVKVSSLPEGSSSLPEGSNDPLFHPISGGAGIADRDYAVAAVSGRIGANPGALLWVYRPALESMQHVLLGCNPGPECVPANKQSLLDLPSSLGPGKDDHLVELRGPLRVGSTLAEDFLLEYTNGIDKVGWGVWTNRSCAR